MNQFFDPNQLARTYRDPVALAILAVDLFPVYAVFAFGWDATPLVFLYWLENLVIGAFALARMIATSMKEHIIGLTGMLFLGPFFFFHYGMFCFVHGQFLNSFAQSGSLAPETGFLGPVGLVESALSSGAHLPLFLGCIIALQLFLFIRDYLMRGQYLSTTMQQEMTAPYGRIIVLHIALFIGMAAMIALGQPMLGILALILLRAVWGMFMTVRRRMSLDKESGIKLTDRHQSVQ